MIPTRSKFPMRTEFLEFRSKASRLSSPHFTAYYLPSKHQSSCSVVVPKKVHKLAVGRNWLKRLTFDALWPLIQDSQLDVVIIYKPLKLDKSPRTKEQILQEINSLKLSS